MRSMSSGVLERLRTLSRLKPTKVLTWRGSPKIISIYTFFFSSSYRARGSRRGKSLYSETRRREKEEKRKKRYRLTSRFYRGKRIISLVIYIDKSLRIGSWFLIYFRSSLIFFPPSATACPLFRCSLRRFTTTFFLPSNVSTRGNDARNFTSHVSVMSITCFISSLFGCRANREAIVDLFDGEAIGSEKRIFWLSDSVFFFFFYFSDGYWKQQSAVRTVYLSFY